jgi:hypothetical protein
MDENRDRVQHKLLYQIYDYNANKITVLMPVFEMKKNTFLCNKSSELNT